MNCLAHSRCCVLRQAYGRAYCCIVKVIIKIDTLSQDFKQLNDINMDFH